MIPTLKEYVETHIGGCEPTQLRLDLELNGNINLARYIVDQYRNTYPSAVVEETAVSEVIEHLDEWLRTTSSKQQAAPASDVQSAARIEPLALKEIKRGDYVTYGPSRVMVIDRIGETVITLEDPFHPKGEHSIEVKRDDFTTHVMRTSTDYVKSEYQRLNKPLPSYFGKPDTERLEAMVIEDRKYLIKEIKKGITDYIGAKRTTSIIRKRLGKWFSELAETLGGELKGAVELFEKQHASSQLPKYTTIQSWVKFYQDFKDTPDDELPTTRNEARKANPAWRQKRKTPLKPRPPRPALRPRTRNSNCSREGPMPSPKNLKTRKGMKVRRQEMPNEENLPNREKTGPMKQMW